MKALLLATLAFIFSLLNVTDSPSYLGLVVDQSEFSFQTGRQQFPIYARLNVKNIGFQPARFAANSDVGWVAVYREGQPTDYSLTLPQTEALDFILEIHPERLADGRHQAQVTVTVMDLRDSVTVLDSQTVTFFLNKNLTTTLTATPSANSTPVNGVIPTASITPVASSVFIPAPTVPAPTSLPKKAVSSPLPRKLIPKSTILTPHPLPAVTIPPPFKPNEPPAFWQWLRRLLF